MADKDHRAGQKHKNATGGGWETHGSAGYLQDDSKPRLLVVHPYLKRQVRGDTPRRSPEARLDEAIGLSEAIDIELVGAVLVPLSKIVPKTFIGGGKCEELKERIENEEVHIVVCDADLSPIQQRNLETALDCKVIDRTALILEIFGARASTKEGDLQVELAHLTYQKSRLVRSWTHLERQRGGGGFMGGPGESQIESDRRMIDDRIVLLKRQLEQVTRTRTLQRASRKKAPYPVVALVGYTNAGKSTLFNKVTNAKVKAEDMLFATLDPTMRGVTLSGGRKIILSDTVGFISELPHMLVAAFRATLEEVLEADIIVHVRDASHEDCELQKQDVITVLKDLGVELEASESKVPVIEAMNKIDLLDERGHEALDNILDRDPAKLAISSLKGEGCGELLERLDDILSSMNLRVEVKVPYSDGASSAWLHSHSEVLSEEAGEEGYTYIVLIDPIRWGQYQKTHGETPDNTVQDDW